MIFAIYVIVIMVNFFVTDDTKYPGNAIKNVVADSIRHLSGVPMPPRDIGTSTGRGGRHHSRSVRGSNANASGA